MDNTSYICLLVTTNLLSFLGGIYKGAAGGYLAQKFTDQRKSQEGEKQLKSKLKEAKSLFPELIKEMKADISNDETKLTIHFNVIPHEKLPFGSQIPLFTYYENEHENLLGKISKLEQLGFVIDVTDSNYPKYKMTEEFINLLKKN